MPLETVTSTGTTSITNGATYYMDGDTTSLPLKTQLPTNFQGTVANIYPSSQMFVRIFPPTAGNTTVPDLTTNGGAGIYMDIGGSGGTGSTGAGTLQPNASTTAVYNFTFTINLYNYIDATGTYQIDVVDETPVDPPTAGAPLLAGVTNPGEKVIQSYKVKIIHNVNVSATIVTK
jgi:hypothetical protein